MRTLRRDAALTTFAILIIGVGVGASTTVFTAEDSPIVPWTMVSASEARHGVKVTNVTERPLRIDDSDEVSSIDLLVERSDVNGTLDRRWHVGQT